MTRHTSCLVAGASRETKHLLIVHQSATARPSCIYIDISASPLFDRTENCIKNKRDFDINRFNKTVVFVHVFPLVVAGPLIATQYNERFEI